MHVPTIIFSLAAGIHSAPSPQTIYTAQSDRKVLERRTTGDAPSSQSAVATGRDSLNQTTLLKFANFPEKTRNESWARAMQVVNDSSLWTNRTLYDQAGYQTTTFFTDDVMKGILIGSLLVFCLLLTLLFTTCCKKRLAKRKIKRFHAIRQKKREDQVELCVVSDVISDGALHNTTARKNFKLNSIFQKQRSGKVNSVDLETGDVTNDPPSLPGTKPPSLPRSVSSLKSCATMLDNVTYDDLIATTKTGDHASQAVSVCDSRHLPATTIPRATLVDVSSASQAATYEADDTFKNRRREHPYETIGCESDRMKIADKPTSVVTSNSIKPISASSQDAKIFSSNATNTNIANKSVRNPSNIREQCDENIHGVQPNMIPTLPSRSSMCVVPSALRDAVEPSPYLLRTWSAPNAATVIRRPRDHDSPEGKRSKVRRSKAVPPKLLQSKKRLKQRFVDAIERKGLLSELSKTAQKEINDCTQFAQLRPHENRFFLEAPRMRRRIKRKVRKKRRVLDERRRKGLQRMRGPDNEARERGNAYDDTTTPKGDNRWPLPGVYFESSSGGSSDMLHFRRSAFRREAYCDAAVREASLLEDIWSHLDELTQRASRIRESYSSRRASDSLSSSSDDVIARHAAENCNRLSPQARYRRPCSTSSDRGYFTSKCFPKSEMRRVADTHRRWRNVPPHQRPRSCVIMTSSGMSTLTDTGTGTGAWISSTATRCSSFSSSRNNSLLGGRPRAYPMARGENLFCHSETRFVVPEITLTSATKNIPLEDEMLVNSSLIQNDVLSSYLFVLESYLQDAKTEEPVYDKLSNCVTIASSNKERASCSETSTIQIPTAENHQLLSVKVASNYALVAKNTSAREIRIVDVAGRNDVVRSGSDTYSNRTHSSGHVIDEQNDRSHDSSAESEKVSDSERTSDTIKNGSEPLWDDVIGTAQARNDITYVNNSNLSEKSKNYVVVTPSLLSSRWGIQLSEEGVHDGKTGRNVTDDLEKEHDDGLENNDEKLLYVFMEMNV